MESKLHEALQPLSWLAGRWSTEEGRGCFPNIKDFQYREQLEFLCIGQPMFNFLSTSQNKETNAPMHQERGFLRIRPGTNDLDFVVSHNFGLTSVEEGQYSPDTKQIVLETVNLSRISSAKPPHVKKFRRVIRSLGDDSLEVTLFMETETTPLTEHLKAVYKKKVVAGADPKSPPEGHHSRSPVVLIFPDPATRIQ